MGNGDATGVINDELKTLCSFPECEEAPTLDFSLYFSLTAAPINYRLTGEISKFQPGDRRGGAGRPGGESKEKQKDEKQKKENKNNGGRKKRKVRYNGEMARAETATRYLVGAGCEL